MVVIEKKTKEIITISFSAKVGAAGLKRIKEFIGFIQLQNSMPKRKVPQSVINKLAEEVNEVAWEKFKQKRGLNF